MVTTLVCLIALQVAEAPQGKAGSVEKYVFKKVGDAELAMHVHFPADWKTSDQRPAIVFFFGGGWTSGSVEQFRPQCEYLASRGMVAARADYRVKSRQNVTPDQCVEDCKSAVRFLRQHAKDLGIDPGRIAAGGGSAGGHTAAATGIVPGFEAEKEDKSISSKPNLLLLYNPVLNTSKLVDRMPAETAKAISPNDHLGKDAPPAIILFGTADKLLAMGEEYIQLGQKLGITAELYTADGAAHGFFNRAPWNDRTLFLVDQFLTKQGYLKGEPTVKPEGGPQMKLVGSSGKK